MSPLEQSKAILLELRGPVCACGAVKKARQSFCRSHYFALPVGMRERLYTAGAGYFQAYREAATRLKLPLPGVAEGESGRRGDGETEQLELAAVTPSPHHLVTRKGGG